MVRVVLDHEERAGQITAAAFIRGGGGGGGEGGSTICIQLGVGGALRSLGGRGQGRWEEGELHSLGEGEGGRASCVHLGGRGRIGVTSM